MTQVTPLLEYRNAHDDARERRRLRRRVLAILLLPVALWLTWTGLRFLVYTLG
jgi:hypothetical protein